jgi:rod shape determining protein RodA
MTLLMRRRRKTAPWQRWIKPWENIDPYLFWIPVGLTVLGGLLIRSAETYQGWTDWSQHWLMGAIGVVLCLAIARVDYRGLLRYHWLVYALTNLSLIAVEFVGTTALGAQRWIPIFGFNVQPSEFAKIGVIISLAALLHQQSVMTIPAILRVVGITLVPWGLIFLQPDLGTSLVFGAITLGMLYWANVNGGWIVLMLSPLLAAILLNLPLPLVYKIPFWVVWVLSMGVVGWLTLPWQKIGAVLSMAVNLSAAALGNVLWSILQDYQRDRLILFLDPDKDPLGGGYHLIQSRIAIGSGQIFGRGLNQGPQTQLNFIPEQHTDFIFSAMGEEFGFIGCALLLVAFWLICVRLLKVANNADDNFGSLLCIGVLAMIVFQVFVNIGMTIGLAPVTGIPLPWMSYGRSAMLKNFISIGLVEAVANHTHRKSRTSKL